MERSLTEIQPFQMQEEAVAFEMARKVFVVEVRRHIDDRALAEAQALSVEEMTAAGYIK